MDFKVTFMTRSIRDLEEITSRIAADNPAAALSLGGNLMEKALSLARFPEMGRLVPEFGNPTIRELIHGAYRIVYRLRKPQKKIQFSAFGTPLAEYPTSEPIIPL
jgi:toxin ParE1/3/4